jgi:His/Glu/Gln/Arg/opine family amino acid ABC transporter permease subunit
MDLGLIVQNLPRIGSGLLKTCQITGLSFSLGLILGSLLGSLQVYGPKPLRWAVTGYTTLFRGTPMMVQITFFYFTLPELGVDLGPFGAASLAIGLNSSAYISQIIRAGILGVKKDEIQAAKALGFSPWQRLTLLVLPQALRRSLPSLTNESITLLKDSSLAYTIGVYEVYKEFRDILNETYDIVTVMPFLVLIYLLMTGVLTLIASQLEKRYAYD